MFKKLPDEDKGKIEEYDWGEDLGKEKLDWCIFQNKEIFVIWILLLLKDMNKQE